MPIDLGCTVDFDELYAKVEALSVDLDFDEDRGLPYIQTKLVEVMQKAEHGVRMNVDLARLRNHLGNVVVQHRALWNLTGTLDHKETAEAAKNLLDQLKEFQEVLKLRTMRLRAIPGELKIYVQTVEDGLHIERNRPGRVKFDGIPKPPPTSQDAEVAALDALFS